jgi:hypothetical protein
VTRLALNRHPPPAAGLALPAGPPPIEITGVRAADGTEIALVHDGPGLVVIVAADPGSGAPPLASLPLDTLTSLLAPGDPVISTVQVVMQADCAASDPESALAATYHQLGYEAEPRSQTIWVVVRHDQVGPAAAYGPAAQAGTTLVAALAGQGQRAADLLNLWGLRARLLTPAAARAVLDETLLAASPAAPGPVPAGLPGPPRDGRVPGAQYFTYRVRRWPDGGLLALQQGLADTPAGMATIAVTLTRAPGDRPGLAGAVRLACDPRFEPHSLARYVLHAAAACDAALDPLDGTGPEGVLATLPLGRRPPPPGRGWPARGASGLSRPESIPVTPGGVVIGAGSTGDLVALPLFGAARGTRMCLAGHPALARLLALRAIGAGARVQAVTARPAGWLKLRRHLRLPSGQLAVDRPGTPAPGDGSRGSPWLVVEDSGGPATGAPAAWRAVVTVMPELPGGPGTARGWDVVAFQETSPDGWAAIRSQMRLPGSGLDRARLPGHALAVAQPGSLRVAWLVPDETERAALVAALQPG